LFGRWWRNLSGLYLEYNALSQRDSERDKRLSSAIRQEFRVKRYSILILLAYAVVMIVFGILDYRNFYWPSLACAILGLCLIAWISIGSIKYIICAWFIICIIIAASEFVFGVYNSGKSRISLGEFAESQFWLSIYFYFPLILVSCFLYFLVNILTVKRGD